MTLSMIIVFAIFTSTTTTKIITIIIILMTNDRRWSDHAQTAAAAAEETADRIMGKKFGIAAGRRLLLAQSSTHWVRRRTRDRPKVNSIIKIYYFYNTQISMNKPSFFHSSVFAVLLYLSQPRLPRARGYCEKTPVAPTAIPVRLRYNIIIKNFFSGPHISVTSSLDTWTWVMSRYTCI